VWDEVQRNVTWFYANVVALLGPPQQVSSLSDKRQCRSQLALKAALIVGDIPFLSSCRGMTHALVRTAEFLTKAPEEGTKYPIFTLTDSEER